MGEWRDEWREANRANWDERVPIHVSGEFYDVASFKDGQERLQPFEIDEVGVGAWLFPHPGILVLEVIVLQAEVFISENLGERVELC